MEKIIINCDTRFSRLQCVCAANSKNVRMGLVWQLAEGDDSEL